MRVSRGGKRASRVRRLINSARYAMGLAVAYPVLLGVVAQGQELQRGPLKLPDPYALPDAQRLFRLENEATLRERMARDSQIGLNPLGLKYEIQFPEYPAVPPPGAQSRDWAPLAGFVRPP